MSRAPIVLLPGEGRSYPMGRMQAVFKADGDETQGAYSVSEWWLDPNTGGPHEHAHPEDHVFFVIEGSLALRLGADWRELPQGSYVMIPGGTPHTFENRGSVRTGFISFNTPGGFERQAQPIANWLAENPLGDAQG